MSEPTTSLDGIRVLDLSRVLAGPYCGALLGDMGADVLKIEDTGGGDESRTWPPQKDGEAAMYIANNRNKRGMSLDLKAADGKRILCELVARSDVLIENFRTGTMESFGLGYDVLAKINPGLVYSSVSAFGRSGPRAAEGGYEALVQAFGGIMSLTGEADGPPTRTGVSVLDIMTGTLCAFGIVNALMYRNRTGAGQRVDGSLLDTSLSLLNFHVQSYLFSGKVPQRLGTANPSQVPYRNFRCRDGQWVFIAGANDRLWQRLAQAIGLGWMVDDLRFATNMDRVQHRDVLEPAVEDAVARYDRADLLALLEAAGVPIAPVNALDQALDDPQTRSRAVLKTMAHPLLGDIPAIGNPLTFSKLQPAIRRHAPRRGEHTDTVLAELGYSSTHIADLRERRVVA